MPWQAVPGFADKKTGMNILFAEQILRLLSDDALRERISAAGRRYVEAHHDWNAIAAQLETIYLRSIKDVQRTNG